MNQLCHARAVALFVLYPALSANACGGAERRQESPSIASPAPQSPAPQQEQQLELAPPPLPVVSPEPGFLYHGVYPGGRSGAEDDITPALVDAYEHAVGRRAAWIYFSHNWFNGRQFPAKTARWIRARGSIPFVRLMLRSSAAENVNERVFTLEAIKRGAFDADLAEWGKSATSFGTPIIAEWGTEMNGQWFAWNGRPSGGARVGPARFRAAYRHMVETIRAAGATNVVWVFHVNGVDDPSDDWNHFENYYPGDDVIDWLGLSVYAAVTPQETGWTGFRDVVDDAVRRLQAISPRKPIYLLEFGAPARNPRGDPAEWADSALDDMLSGRWPALRGFSWWNEHWENDDTPSHDTEMRVQALSGLARVFKERLASDHVIDRPLAP